MTLFIPYNTYSLIRLHVYTVVAMKKFCSLTKFLLRYILNYPNFSPELTNINLTFNLNAPSFVGAISKQTIKIKKRLSLLMTRRFLNPSTGCLSISVFGEGLARVP